MKRIALIVVALVTGCENSCGPGPHDYIGCSAACVQHGVKRVRFNVCECNGAPAYDAGVTR